MKIRLFITFILLFFIMIPLSPQESLISIFIESMKPSGDAAQFAQNANKIILENITRRGFFIIVEKKDAADYVLSSEINIESDELILTMKLTGISTRALLKETIVKKGEKETGVSIILNESLDYFHRLVFPFDLFVSENVHYFTSKSMKTEYQNDVVDRKQRMDKRKKKNKKVEATEREYIQVFEPLNMKLFSNLRFQIFPSIEAGVPANLIDDYVKVAPSVHLPVYFYVYTSEIIMASILVEGFYFPLEKQTSMDTFNTLNVLGAGLGVRVSYPLPVYNLIGFHLSLTGGMEGSFLTSSGYQESQIYVAFNPYIHPVFEIEHVITRNFSLSVRCSYILVLYAGEYLHMVQPGMGLGIRF